MTDLIGSQDNLHEEPSFLNSSRNILGVVISGMVLQWICALLRLYTRFFIIKSPWWDDLFVVLALAATSAGSIAICLSTTVGFGQHFILLGEQKMSEYLRIFYIANATYPSSAGFIKLALLFQFLRIYEKGSRLWYTTVGTIVIVFAWCIGYGILGWVPTIPIQAYWDLTLPATRYAFGSLEVETFVYTYTSLTATNMILDIIILAIPAPLLLYNKTSSTKSRWALICLFSIGSMASIFSIWRLASIIETRAATYPTFDPTWYGPTPIVLAALEVDVATICASLPVFWPVLQNIDMSQILVTREVKVTLEHRRLSTGGTDNDPDDDGIELQRSKSGLQAQSSKNYYEDPYVAQQVNPFKEPEEFGTRAEINNNNTSHGARHLRKESVKSVSKIRASSSFA
ncbi:hypothetical protein INS49_003692 [Diaporthe citri]|uniref:uncharacterized protein n=1 Tax=Diaporthe citri TaxID=83186 RepID=UPI001C802325|nr:uncharacterized protein INS49_003692 [Diaporthe citri]KAG6355728.1 hypothetical protein INS49_003692 [Diaporthe citri]